MVDFDHLGYELNRCGGFLDGIQNCIQTCLHHTVKGCVLKVKRLETIKCNVLNFFNEKFACQRKNSRFCQIFRPVHCMMKAGLNTILDTIPKTTAAV